MKIGELAAKTGAQTETIRYYEREGLLPEAGRTESNYRVYDPGHIARLAFIRHCRSLDMTLDEIRTLLRFKDAPDEDCEEVNALLDEHIEHVADRIKELKLLQADLKVLRSQCNTTRDAAACGILTGLDKAARTPFNPGPKAKKPADHVHGAHSSLARPRVAPRRG